MSAERRTAAIVGCGPQQAEDDDGWPQDHRGPTLADESGVATFSGLCARWSGSI